MIPAYSPDPNILDDADLDDDDLGDDEGLDDEDQGTPAETPPGEGGATPAATPGGSPDVADSDPTVQQYLRGFEAIGTALTQVGVSRPSIATAVNFLAEFTKSAEPGSVVRRDAYKNIDGSGIAASDQGDLVNFLAAMHQAKVPESDVTRILDWARTAYTKGAHASVKESATPAPSSRNDARIAEIESVMKTDRRRYNHDAGMQAEYLSLLRQRGS